MRTLSQNCEQTLKKMRTNRIMNKRAFLNFGRSASPKPHPSKPRPCNMPQAKTEVALQFSECCTAETALQHCLFCSAEVIWTKSCAAANEKLHCSIEKATLQESGAFLQLSCGFKPPRLGTHVSDLLSRETSRCLAGPRGEHWRGHARRFFLGAQTPSLFV